MYQRENKEFESYILPDLEKGEITKQKIRNEIEKDLENSDITATGLQNEQIGTIIIEEYRKEVLKRMKNAKYMDILASYTNSIFQYFERYLRTEVDLFQDVIRLVLDG